MKRKQGESLSQYSGWFRRVYMGSEWLGEMSGEQWAEMWQLGRSKRPVAFSCFVCRRASSSKLWALISTHWLRGYLLTNVSLRRLYYSKASPVSARAAQTKPNTFGVNLKRVKRVPFFTVSWQDLIEWELVGRCTLSIINTTLHRHAGNAAGARPRAQFGPVPPVANKEKQKNCLSYKTLNLLVLKQQL